MKVLDFWTRLIRLYRLQPFANNNVIQLASFRESEADVTQC